MKFIARFFAAAVIITYLSPVLVFAQATTSTTTAGSVAPPRCAMRAVPSVISPGGSIALQWSSINAEGGTITGVGGVGPSGSINLLPSNAPQSVFVGTFTGAGGTATCSATVQVVYGTTPAGGPTDVTSGGTTAVPVTAVPSTQTPVATAPITQSPDGGLVPCGFGSGIQNSTSCQACNLAQLVQNLINFAIGISIPIAAVLFAWAGILYFTSGADPSNKERAKGIFKNAFVGFLIAISAWLVVNTILHTLLSGGSIPQNSWFTVQCSANRPVQGTINQLLNSVLPDISTTLPVSTSGSFNGNFNAAMSSFTPSCDTANGYVYDGAGNCINEFGDTQAPTYSSSTSIPNAQLSQLVANACSQYGLDSSQCMSVDGFLGAESSGGTRCTPSTTGAIGCFQVLPTTACSIDPSIAGCSTCSRTTGGSLGAGCATVAQTIADPVINTNLGVHYIAQQYNTFGSCQTAASAYFQGPGLTSSYLKSYGTIPPAAVDYANKVCGGQ